MSEHKSGRSWLGLEKVTAAGVFGPPGVVAVLAHRPQMWKIPSKVPDLRPPLAPDREISARGATLRATPLSLNKLFTVIDNEPSFWTADSLQVEPSLCKMKPISLPRSGRVSYKTPPESKILLKCCEILPECEWPKVAREQNVRPYVTNRL